MTVMFREIADGVHVLRYPVLDVNSVLVVGHTAALLVDTLSCAEQGEELAMAVREVTRLPVTVVNTHAHFDHIFGNATVARLLGVEEIHAHPTVVRRLRDHAESMVEDAWHECRLIAPEIAESVRRTEILTPNRPVHGIAAVDLGGRSVRIWHPGAAHTTADLVLLAGEVFIAGDLVEEGAEPDTADADLAGWPVTLSELLPLMHGPVVPGHGAVVDADFVRAQRDRLAVLASGADVVNPGPA